MSQKDYIALAAALAAVRPVPGQHAQMLRWQLCRNAVANVLQRDNPKFSPSLFQKACNA